MLVLGIGFNKLLDCLLFLVDLLCKVLQALLVHLIPGFGEDLSRQNQRMERKLLKDKRSLGQVVAERLLNFTNFLHFINHLWSDLASDLLCELD